MFPRVKEGCSILDKKAILKISITGYSGKIKTEGDHLAISDVLLIHTPVSVVSSV